MPSLSYGGGNGCRFRAIPDNMSFQFSITIICKNAAGFIERTVNSVSGLSDDVVVYDSGSTDQTIELLKAMPVQLYEGPWEGFGKTRQKAAELARYPWVLVIDADEIVSPALGRELKSLDPQSDQIAYSIELKNHLGEERIKWGSWGYDFRIRLYNRNFVRWNDAMVHEKPVLSTGVQIQKLKYPVLHYTARTKKELWDKMHHYALLTAAQYHLNGKKASWIKRSSGPLFAFLKSFFFKFGFMDGKGGFDVASIIARYTYLKYHRLHELERNSN